jgi:hypothetical protein
LFVKSKGGAGTWFLDSTTNTALMVITGPANTTNYVVAESATGTNSPRITPGAPLGSDIGFDVRSLGTGVVQANGTQVEVKGHTHAAADVVGALSWTTTVPATPSAAGTRGQVAADSGFLYVCLNSGAAGAAVWKRVAFDIWV